MSAPLDISYQAREAGWNAMLAAQVQHLDPGQQYAAAIEAAAPKIVAAALRRFASTIDSVPDPAGDAWLHAETAGRREVKRNLLARADELDPL